MASDDILCEAAEGVLTITLNRPDKLNAFTPALGDDMIAAYRPRRRGRRDPRRDRHRQWPRVLRRGRSLRGRRPVRREPAARSGRRRRDRLRAGGNPGFRRPARFAHIRQSEARYRRREWGGRGSRRHHASADGYSAGVDGREVRVSFRPTRDRAGGVLDVVSAACGRHAARDGMGRHGPHISGGGSAGGGPRAQLACAGRTAAGRTRSRGGGRAGMPRPYPWPCRASSCGACWERTIRCRRTGRKAACCSIAAAARTSRKA